MTNREVAKKEKNEVNPTTTSDWDDAFEIEASDVVIPKILLMQGLSKHVANENAQMGDLVHGSTGEFFGTAREKNRTPVEILPIKNFKEWAVYENIGGKREFRYIEPVTAQNANAPMQETVDGKDIERDYVLNFYVMLPGKQSSLPYVVSFRRTSLKAGKDLLTHILELREKRLPPVHNVINLCGTKRENDHGTFYVFDVEVGREANDQERAEAKKMLDLVKSANTRVDHSDLEENSSGEKPVEVEY